MAAPIYGGPSPMVAQWRSQQSMWAERERSKFPLTAHTSLCNPRSPLRAFPLHRIFSRPAPAPLPLIQFSDPFRSRSTPHRGMSKGGPLMAPKNIVVPVRATGKYRWKVKWAISYRFKSLILCQFLNIMSYNVGMPIWVHRKYFTKSIEKNVFEFEIRKLTAECKCTLTYEISQLL